MIAAPQKSSAAAPKRCAAVEVPFELCQFGSFVFGEVSTFFCGASLDESLL